MFTKKFWIDATDRAIKSGAQILAILVGASSFNILHANYAELGGMGLTAVLLSYLTSLASETVRPDESGAFLQLKD